MPLRSSPRCAAAALSWRRPGWRPWMQQRCGQDRTPGLLPILLHGLPSWTCFAPAVGLSMPGKSAAEVAGCCLALPHPPTLPTPATGDQAAAWTEPQAADCAELRAAGRRDPGWAAGGGAAGGGGCLCPAGGGPQPQHCAGEGVEGGCGGGCCGRVGQGVVCCGLLGARLGLPSAACRSGAMPPGHPPPHPAPALAPSPLLPSSPARRSPSLWAARSATASMRWGGPSWRGDTWPASWMTRAPRGTCDDHLCLVSQLDQSPTWAGRLAPRLISSLADRSLGVWLVTGQPTSADLAGWAAA